MKKFITKKEYLKLLKSVKTPFLKDYPLDDVFQLNFVLTNNGDFDDINKFTLIIYLADTNGSIVDDTVSFNADDYEYFYDILSKFVNAFVGACKDNGYMDVKSVDEVIAECDEKVQTIEQVEQTNNDDKNDNVDELANGLFKAVTGKDSTLATATKLDNALKVAYASTSDLSIKICFILKSIYDNKFYEDLGYKNIYDYAKDKYEIARGTVNTFISVATAFGVDNGNNGGLILELDKRMADYSISKLMLLRMYTIDFILDNFKPTMTCKEIKEKNKALSINVTNNASLLENGSDENVVDSSDDDSIDSSDSADDVGTENDNAELRFILVGGSSLPNDVLKAVNSLLNSHEGTEFKLVIQQ